MTMGLNGDIAFASPNELDSMLEYCNKWSDRTFVLQTKDPFVFLLNGAEKIKENMIVGTTIESDICHDVSKAPAPIKRYEAIRSLDCRKMVTIEPILTFNLNVLFGWIRRINPEVVYIGYDSKNNNLPEPTLDETKQLIKMLRDNGFDVKEKLIRKAWYE